MSANPTCSYRVWAAAGRTSQPTKLKDVMNTQEEEVVGQKLAKAMRRWERKKQRKQYRLSFHHGPGRMKVLYCSHFINERVRL